MGRMYTKAAAKYHQEERVKLEVKYKKLQAKNRQQAKRIKQLEAEKEKLADKKLRAERKAVTNERRTMVG